MGERESLYCYVDESGQDTQGEFFVVSVVIGDSHRDELIAKLEAIESRSGKGRVKWIKVRSRHRVAYITEVLNSAALKGKLFYATYSGTKSYMSLTVLATARAILHVRRSHIPAIVCVDGLPKARLRWFGVELRRLSVRTDKVVGVRREETDPLIRLADACCGFVRAGLSGQAEFTALFEKARTSGFLTEV